MYKCDAQGRESVRLEQESMDSFVSALNLQIEGILAALHIALQFNTQMGLPSGPWVYVLPPSFAVPQGSPLAGAKANTPQPSGMQTLQPEKSSSVCCHHLRAHHVHVLHLCQTHNVLMFIGE